MSLGYSRRAPLRAERKQHLPRVVKFALRCASRLNENKDLAMRRYGRIQGLVLSLGWTDFYRDVAKDWRGIGMLYLLLVIALTWIPLLVKLQLFINRSRFETSCRRCLSTFPRSRSRRERRPRRFRSPTR